MGLENLDNMSVSEAAEYLRLSKSTLDRLRLTGFGPPYAQGQPRGRVIYRRCDLDEWLAQRTFRSTSEAFLRGTTA